ncbi:MAG TPA: 4'-phosphopantetheinyl transferase superfamily protein [Dyella sp.]|nr:4'-phosphopantetheinyl transferase superfamily protein [Dyella sp.]
MNDSADTHGGVQAVSARGATRESGVACVLNTIKATPAALWREARDACDDALRRGHVFVAILHGMDAFADERLLADADGQRAARYRRPGDRHNFVLGRNLVHHLVRPRGIPTPCAFSIAPRGKPFLPNAPAYNLSHSGSWVACAVSRDESVGIDVETFARLKDYRDLLAVIAHPAERRYIEQAPSDDRLTLFKRCWTRKEAVLKATGEGLHDALQTMDVCLERNEPVLDHPAPLRLMHLMADQAEATIALALHPSVPGVVVMYVGEPH